jgi:hypothetical protein
VPPSPPELRLQAGPVVYSGDAVAATAYLDRLRKAASELPEVAGRPQARGDAGEG